MIVEIVLSVLLVGAAVALFLLHAKRKAEVAVMREQREAMQRRIEEQQQACDRMTEEMGTMRRDREERQTEVERLKSDMVHANATLSDREQALDECRARLTALEEERNKLLSDTAVLASQRDAAQQTLVAYRTQIEKEEEERRQRFDRQLQLAQQQLIATTQELLDKRAETLGKVNNEQMSGVVTPLKEQLKTLLEQMERSRTAVSESRTSIEEHIKLLVEQTTLIGNDAVQLARALKGENKTQGNWGEMILDKILENSGLEKGVDYELQTTLRDERGQALVGEESGGRMIPDVVVHYPDGKDVIIDSKVSLTAYLDYCNAETDAARETAAARHVASVRQHVRELRHKNYAAYIRPPREGLQYVIMFVPNEMAMQLALSTDPTLWHEAFEGGVCMVSEQNLMVLLRMIKVAWVQMQQIKNQQEITAQATQLLDRVLRFTERLDKVSSDIDKMRDDFDDARRAFDGRQGILGAAKQMERLGAKASQQRVLPEPDEN